MTIRNIRSFLTDGSNHCCQSNVGPLQHSRRAGDGLLITVLSVWLWPHIKPNVLPVVFWQPVTGHLSQDTENWDSPASTRACVCVCVSEAQIGSDRSQDATKKEVNHESGDGVCS